MAPTLLCASSDPYPYPEPTQVPIACERRLSAQKRVELLTPPLESFVHAEGALRV